MNELTRLQERVFELETRLGIKSDVFHMYEGCVDSFPPGTKKVIGHMPPIVRIEFGGKQIQFWGGEVCFTLDLDAKPFKHPFTFEIAHSR
jgi:hypothetical protein